MAFRISNVCDNWFSNLSKEEPLKRIFDYYYLCTLLGLAARQPNKILGESKEFVDYFISPYQNYQRRLIGLLVLTRLHRDGVALEEKTAVAAEFSRIVAPHNGSHLTEDGFELLNAYCQGGFDILSEALEKPHDMVFFLWKYSSLLQQKIAENPVWQKSILSGGGSHS